MDSFGNGADDGFGSIIQTLGNSLARTALQRLRSALRPAASHAAGTRTAHPKAPKAAAPQKLGISPAQASAQLLQALHKAQRDL